VDDNKGDNKVLLEFIK